MLLYMEVEMEGGFLPSNHSKPNSCAFERLKWILLPHIKVANNKNDRKGDPKLALYSVRLSEKEAMNVK
jgi:hypothetical protein